MPSCCVQLAGMVQGLILLVNPNANVGELWQATLLLYCFVLMAVGFNIFCAQHLPLAEGKLWPRPVSRFLADWRQAYSYAYTSLASSSSCSPSGSWQIMPPLQRSLPSSSGSSTFPCQTSVLIMDSDGGGWGSQGLSCLVGLSTPVWCFIGPDAGAHMSEELKDSSLQLPKAMMWATVLNGVLGITMLITFW